MTTETLSPSMFDTLHAGLATPRGTSAAQSADKVLRNVTVGIREVFAKTYNLSDPEQCGQYTYDYEQIITGVNAKTHALLAKEPLKFAILSGAPCYIAHLQWIEFEIKEEELTAVPTAQQDRERRIAQRDKPDAEGESQ